MRVRARALRRRYIIIFLYIVASFGVSFAVSFAVSFYNLRFYKVLIYRLLWFNFVVSFAVSFGVSFAVSFGVSFVVSLFYIMLIHSVLRLDFAVSFCGVILCPCLWCHLCPCLCPCLRSRFVAVPFFYLLTNPSRKINRIVLLN